MDPVLPMMLLLLLYYLLLMLRRLVLLLLLHVCMLCEHRRRRGRLDDVLRSLLPVESRRRRRRHDRCSSNSAARGRRVDQWRRVCVVVPEPMNQPVLAQLHRFMLVSRQDRREVVDGVGALLFSHRVPAAAVQLCPDSEKRQRSRR